MLKLIEISFMCTVIAYVYSEVLIKPGMLFHKMWKRMCSVWLYKIKIDSGKEVVSESWFYKPLGGCYKCVTGQFALWGYLIYSIRTGYNIGFHLFVISLSIVMVVILKSILKKIEE